MTGLLCHVVFQTITIIVFNKNVLHEHILKNDKV